MSPTNQCPSLSPHDVLLVNGIVMLPCLFGMLLVGKRPYWFFYKSNRRKLVPCACQLILSRAQLNWKPRPNGGWMQHCWIMLQHFEQLAKRTQHCATWWPNVRDDVACNNVAPTCFIGLVRALIRKITRYLLQLFYRATNSWCHLKIKIKG